MASGRSGIDLGIRVGGTGATKETWSPSAWVVLPLAILAGLALAMIAGMNRPSASRDIPPAMPTAQAPDAPDITFPQAGSAALLDDDDPSARYSLLAADRDTYRILLHAITEAAEGNAFDRGRFVGACKALEATGKLFRVAHPARVTVEDKVEGGALMALFVRVEEGDQAGKSGWIASTRVRPLSAMEGPRR